MQKLRTKRRHFSIPFEDQAAVDNTGQREQLGKFDPITDPLVRALGQMLSMAGGPSPWDLKLFRATLFHVDINPTSLRHNKTRILWIWTYV